MDSSQGYLFGGHDRQAHGKGSSRVFTLKRALAVGLAAELVKIGISIGLAGDLSGKVIDMTLQDAGDDVTRIDHLIALYPQDALSVRYGAARQDDAIGEVPLEDAPQDALSVRHGPARRDDDALSVRYGAAGWDDTIQKVLVEDAPQDVSSVVIVSVKLVAQRVLRRLGELEKPQLIES